MKYGILGEVIQEYLEGIAREGFRLNEMPYLQEVLDGLMSAADDPSLTFQDWVHELRYWETYASDARGDERIIIMDNLLPELMNTLEIVERRGY
jgi:hypothetical protein